MAYKKCSGRPTLLYLICEHCTENSASWALVLEVLTQQRTESGFVRRE